MSEHEIADIDAARRMLDLLEEKFAALKAGLHETSAGLRTGTMHQMHAANKIDKLLREFLEAKA